MSNQYLKLRRSAIPGKIPDTSSMDFGEIALNTYDGLAFMKKSGSNGEEIITINSTIDNFSGSFIGTFTGSLYGTASYAISSSFSQTASYVQTAQTASYVQTAQTASYVQTAQTASYVLNAISASQSQNSNTASYVQNAQSASYVQTAQTAQTASYIFPSSLTKVDDTNITLTLSGSPTSSLLQPVTLTLGWTGSLADSRIASAATWNAKQNALTNPITGTGENNRIPTFNGTTSLTSTSTFTFDGTSLGVGIATPDASALLDLTSTTKGLLPPRATTSQINAVSSPATGLMMIDTDKAKLAIYNGVAWQDDELLNMKTMKALGSSVKAWTTDPFTASGTATLTDAQQLFASIFIDEKCTLTGVRYMMNTAGNFTGDNTNSIQLYSINASTGLKTKLAETANDQNIWKATANTLATANFTASVTVNPGVYYIALLYNNSIQTTAPIIRTAVALGNSNQPAWDLPFSMKTTSVINGQTAAQATLASSATAGITTRPLIGVF